jgi:hypothetical protein
VSNYWRCLIKLVSTSITTEAAKEYKKTDGHIDSLAYWGNWLRDTEGKLPLNFVTNAADFCYQGKSVKKDVPVPAAYPDRQNENYPVIPDFEEGVGVDVLRKIVRVAVTAVWRESEQDIVIITLT